MSVLISGEILYFWGLLCMDKMANMVIQSVGILYDSGMKGKVIMNCLNKSLLIKKNLSKYWFNGMV